MLHRSALGFSFGEKERLNIHLGLLLRTSLVYVDVR